MKREMITLQSSVNLQFFILDPIGHWSGLSSPKSLLIYQLHRFSKNMPFSTTHNEPVGYFYREPLLVLFSLHYVCILPALPDNLQPFHAKRQ